MSESDSGFRLHTDYVFHSSQNNPIPMEVLSPHLVTPLGCGISYIAMVIALIVGLAVVISVVLAVLANWQYAREGQPTTALVTGCRVGTNGELGRNPTIDYIYTVDNIAYKESDHMDGRCEAYPTGRLLNALYLASTPAKSRIVQAGVTEREADLILIIIAIVWRLVLCFSFAQFFGNRIARYVYALRNRHALATSSILLEGKVAAINRYTPSKSHNSYVCVWYTFETPAHEVLKGFAEAHRQDLRYTDLPPVGTPVTVLYADNGSHMIL